MTDRHTFDFRQQGWGHAMHASTFQAVAPRTVKRKRFGGPLTIPRVSVMVHCHNPREGDLVIYRGQSGADRTLVIADVESCANVDGMFTLTLEPLTAKEADQC